MGSKKKLKSRNRYSDAKKASAVRKVEAGASVPTIAKQLGCADASVYNWLAQSRGYKNVEDMRGEGVGVHGPVIERKDSSGRLPTTSAKIKVVRSSKKALIANSFQCPHCSGPIDLEAPIKAVSR